MFDVPVALCSSIMFSLSGAAGAPPFEFSVHAVRATYPESQGASDRAVKIAYLAALTGSCNPTFAPSLCDSLSRHAGTYLDNPTDFVLPQATQIPAYMANLNLQLARLTGQCR